MNLPFTTGNLKKVLALSKLTDLDVDYDATVIKNVTYCGDTFPEGTIPLKTVIDHAVNLNSIKQFNNLLDMVWGSILVQIGTRNRQACLFIYQD